MNKPKNKYPFRNPPLPYSYDALEPFIDTKTMKIHHDKLLQGYVDKLNAVLADYPLYWNWSLQKLLANSALLPAQIQTQVHNYAGGVFNHVFYFNGMTPAQQKWSNTKLEGLLSKGSMGLDMLKSSLKEAALSVFGSGYAWLVKDKNGVFKILTTANQDTPISLNAVPLLNIDVWEHAYFLKHYGNRGEYIDDFFNVVNWDLVERRIENA